MVRGSAPPSQGFCKTAMICVATLGNNTGSLIDYGERYRSNLPISTSRAERCVDEIANASLARKRRMGGHHKALIG